MNLCPYHITGTTAANLVVVRAATASLPGHYTFTHPVHGRACQAWPLVLGTTGLDIRVWINHFAASSNEPYDVLINGSRRDLIDVSAKKIAISRFSMWNGGTIGGSSESLLAWPL